MHSDTSHSVGCLFTVDEQEAFVSVSSVCYFFSHLNLGRESSSTHEDVLLGFLGKLCGLPFTCGSAVPQEPCVLCSHGHLRP